MNSRRIVLDTNVIISAFLKPQSLPRRVLEHVLQEHVFLISLDTFGELRERLLHKKFDRYVSRTLRLHFLRLLPTLSKNVERRTTIKACRDPKDNKFLELAVDGQADYIITGDADLLALHPFRGIEISTPQAFSQLLTLGS